MVVVSGVALPVMFLTIQTWIKRWRKELGPSWGTVEIDDVTEYPNDRYYRLEGES